MNDSDRSELFKLIDNEINLAFTLLQTAELASSKKHRMQAIGNAVTAYQTARRLNDRSAEHDPFCESRLAELERMLHPSI